MKKRLLALLLALSLLPVRAAAEETGTYLVLGDSISTGYGLGEEEPSFVDLVARERGYTVLSHAVDGNTARGILAQFESGALDGDIAAADFITITVGGNDMMGLLYQETAALYNSTHDTPIDPKDITQMLARPPYDMTDLLLIGYALTVLEGNEERGVIPLMESEAFEEALEAFRQDLSAITAYIRQRNTAAHIVLTTQYHPYGDFSGDAFGILGRSIGQGARRLREAVMDHAEGAGYLAADVYAAFEEEDAQLCNAAPEPLELDFHPNAAGHALIAGTILALELPEQPALPGAPEAPEVPEEPEAPEGEKPSPSKPAIRPDREEKPESSCPSSAFTDLPAAYHRAIDAMVERGLMGGTTETTFSPDAPLSRAMLVTILHRMEGSPDVPADYAYPFFTDAGGSWCFDALRWAACEGIVNGYGDGTFRPDDPVTRDQLLTVLDRYARYKGLEMEADGSAVSALATRAQTAQVLYPFI